MNFRFASTPRARLARLGLALLAAGLAASPVAARADSATVLLTGLGTQGGTASYATGINDSGQVVGYALHGGFAVSSAFLYSNGISTTLAGLGGQQAYAYAINNAGLIVGQARTADGTQTRAVAFAGAVAQDINPPFGVKNGSASGINSSGAVAGWVQTGNASYSGFITSHGSFTRIGTLVAGGVTSDAYGINDAGQVVGDADAVASGGGAFYSHAFLRSAGGTMQDLGTLNGANNTGSHAFSFSQGVMSDLGTLGGDNSNAYAINGGGLIVGDAQVANGAQHAALWNRGVGYDLNVFAPAGWTLNTATGINVNGQIVGVGTHGGHDEAFLLQAPPPTWLGASGQWDDPTRWNYGTLWTLNDTPHSAQDVVITTAGSANILGSSSASVLSLRVGGPAGSIVTFNRNGGKTSTANGTRIEANAELTGSGELSGPLTVLAGGVLQVGGGQSMLLSGGPVPIQGVARIYGGGGTANLTALAPVTVASGGQLNLQDANLDLRAGLTVQGQMNAGVGGNNIAGAVTVAPAGKVVLSGNGATTFYGPVEVQSAAEFRVSAGAAATFFGLVTQRTGALFTGTGGKYFEGGFSVGASPGLGTDEGSVTFGGSNFYLAEIGGTTACTAACASDDALKNRSFDKYTVSGHLALGGTLKLVSWNGFVAQAGQRFDLLDRGSASGSFGSVDASGLQLAAGTALDLSRLYTQGEIGVVAVPEPASWALLAGGLLAFALRRRQRSAGHHRT